MYTSFVKKNNRREKEKEKYDNGERFIVNDSFEIFTIARFISRISECILPKRKERKKKKKRKRETNKKC